MRIKNGRTGNAPKLTHILWQGTAEILLDGCHRVPAALIDTNKGTMAVVRLAGNDFDRDDWWDARITECREWENPDGQAIDPHVAAKVDAVLAVDTPHLDAARKSLQSRVRDGLYSIV